MAEVTNRDRELAHELAHELLYKLNPPDHDTMEPWQVAEYVEQLFAQVREEGERKRSEPRDAHVIEKRRRHGDRDGDVVYYAVGPQRATMEEAELDLSVWRMRDA